MLNTREENSACSFSGTKNPWAIAVARICWQLLLAYKYLEGSREAISKGVLSVFMTTAR